MGPAFTFTMAVRVGVVCGAGSPAESTVCSRKNGHSGPQLLHSASILLGHSKALCSWASHYQTALANWDVSDAQP